MLICYEQPPSFTYVYVGSSNPPSLWLLDSHILLVASADGTEAAEGEGQRLPDGRHATEPRLSQPRWELVADGLCRYRRISRGRIK